MNSRSARVQIEGVSFDKDVFFKSPEPTTRVLSRGRAIEYRAYQYPYTTSTEHEPKQQRTARAGALTHHPAWVGHHTGGPGQHPQYTGSVTTGGCGCLNDHRHTTTTKTSPNLRPVYAIAGKIIAT